MDPCLVDNSDNFEMIDCVCPYFTALLFDKDYMIKVPEKNSYCGIGKRTQIIVCRDQEMNNVSASICGQKGTNVTNNNN